MLIAAEYPIYGRFGYGPAARGTTREVEAELATPSYGGEGTIRVADAATFRKEAPAVFDRVRRSRPGMIDRDLFDWDMRSDVRRYPEGKPWHGFRILCVDDAGSVQGYARYTVKDDWSDMRPRSMLEVAELAAATPAAEARLWAYLLSLDLIGTIKAPDRPLDDVLPWLLVDGRHAKQTSCFDMLWLRPLDVPRLLTTRAVHGVGARRRRGRRPTGPRRRALRRRRLTGWGDVHDDDRVGRADAADTNARGGVPGRRPPGCAAPRRLAR